MVTDRWPSQEGVIVKGLVCGFGYCGDASVDEGDWVTFGTSANDKVAVKKSAAIGDSFARALKAGAQYDTIPILISGICKVLVDETLVIGSLIISKTVTQVVGHGASTTLTINSATQILLGYILQATTDESDEVLAVIGDIKGLTG